MILRYAKYRLAEGRDTISSVDIEDSLPKYGNALWDTTRLPSAYSREFRKIREKEEYRQIGIIDLKEIKENNKMKTWEIIL